MPRRYCFTANSFHHSFVRRPFVDNTKKTGNETSDVVDALRFFLLLVGVAGSPAAMQADLPLGEPIAMHQFDREFERKAEDLKMAANARVVNVPLAPRAPDTYTQSLTSKFTAVSIDEPASPLLTTSHDLRPARSDVPPLPRLHLIARETLVASETESPRRFFRR